MRFDLSVQGLPNFEAIGDYDPTQALDKIGLHFLARVRLNFREGVNPHGVGWPALKSRQGQPLLDTGRLLKSVGYVVRNHAVEIGSNLSYAAFHNDGTLRIPQRQFIPETSNPPQSWLDLAAKAFVEDLRTHVSRTAR